MERFYRNCELVARPFWCTYDLDCFIFFEDEEVCVTVTFFFLAEELTMEIFYEILIGPYLTPKPMWEVKAPVLFLLENSVGCCFPLWKLLLILRDMLFAD